MHVLNVIRVPFELPLDAELGEQERDAEGALASPRAPPRDGPNETRASPPQSGKLHAGNLGMLILLLKIVALCASLPIELADWGRAMQSYHSAYAT